jgi:hypothetical protein
MTDELLIGIAKRHPISLAMVHCAGDQLSEGALKELFKELAPKLKVCLEKKMCVCDVG